MSRTVEPGQAVLLLHGLWMGGWAMSWLAHALRERGFDPHAVSYDSVRGGPEDHVQKLRQHIESAALSSPGGKVHLIGHSMGGLVVLRCALIAGLLPLIGRAVLLGTPLRGSQAALAFERQPWGHIMLGKSLELWHAPLPSTIGEQLEFGAIAGDEAFGLGPLFVSLAQPSDGVVTVEETRIDGLRDHRVLHVSHTGMLISKEVAAHSAAFLQTGAFLP